MLNLKKEAETLEVGELIIGTCPVCSSYVANQYFMQDATTKKRSKWFSCKCGVCFQNKKPTGIYDQAYYERTSNLHPKTQTSYEYPIRIYAPLIEELIYGRRVLLIGQNNHYQSEAFAKRGWVPTTIDKNTRYSNSHDFIASDFEHYQFPEATKYNLIWFYHSLECLTDPIASLALCKKLLAEDGILFIATPDTDFINTRSSSCFLHWKPDYNHIMWNRRSLTAHLDSLGFNTILARQNYEHRFPVWDDVHLIAQKRFF